MNYCDYLINVMPDQAYRGCTRVECHPVNTPYLRDNAMVTCFYGPDHHRRASQYANFLNNLRLADEPEMEIDRGLAVAMGAARGEQVVQSYMPPIPFSEE